MSLDAIQRHKPNSMDRTLSVGHGRSLQNRPHALRRPRAHARKCRSTEHRHFDGGSHETDGISKRDIMPTVTSKTNDILTFLRASKGATTEEIVKALHFKRSSIAGRLTELVRRGKVRVVGYAVNRFKHRSALYALTAGGASPTPTLIPNATIPPTAVPIITSTTPTVTAPTATPTRLKNH